MEKQLIRAHFPAKRPCPNTWVDGAVMTLVQKSEKEVTNDTLKTKRAEYGRGNSRSYQLGDGIGEGGVSLLVRTVLSKEQ